MEPPGGIIRDMDINAYALEILVSDRLARARAEAAVHALLANPAVRPPRAPLRVRLGLALIGLGRRLRGPGRGARGWSGARWSGVRGSYCNGVRGGRLGPRVA